MQPHNIKFLGSTVGSALLLQTLVSLLPLAKFDIRDIVWYILLVVLARVSMGHLKVVVDTGSPQPTDSEA